MGEEVPSDSVENETPRESFQEEFTEVEKNLFDLDRMDIPAEPFESVSVKKAVQAILSSIDEDLRMLEAALPQDAEVIYLRAMYNDLKEDFRCEETLDLDESMETVISEMRAELRWKNPAWVTPEAVSDGHPLHPLLNELDRLKIKAEYVLIPDPPASKTVVLYRELHPSAAMALMPREDQLIIRASQEQIYRESKSMIESGLTHTVYAEGFAVGQTFKNRNPVNADARLQQEFGEALHFEGVEEPALIENREEVLYDPQMPAAERAMHIRHRTTAQNVFIAQNVAENLHASEENIAIFPIGISHETSDLPISELLAYYGCNVVVVDAASTLASPD